MTAARVVILGAGFGGLEIAATLSERLGDDADVVLIDRADAFVLGFSKLDVMFGRTSIEHVTHRYADLVRPGVRFVQATIEAIDPATKEVITDRGAFEAETLVVALGADLHPEATRGLVEDGHEFYTVEGAVATGEALAGFEGGRVVVGVTGTPFKCPPAPSETALLVHDFLGARGLLARSTVSLVMPFPTPVPPAPDASRAILAAFVERCIGWHRDALVRELDPERHVALLSDGVELGYDLFLGVPVHRPPDVVVRAGLTSEGWVPVDPLTLETAYPDVYAVGDVTSVGTPKAGVFAEGQASVVAAAIVARLQGSPPTSTYDGHGVCYMEFGEDMVAKIDVTFVSGHPPAGVLEGPSTDLVADKVAFGSERIRRWFDRSWTPL